MPSTIPYDPTLILGQIISKDKLSNIEAIAAAQAPSDAAKLNLNAQESLKRELDMTIQELTGMGINTNEVIAESEKVGADVAAAAVAYAKARIASAKAIVPLQSKIIMVNDSIESPIDYNKSQLKKMPISADSLSLDCQYFSFDQNSQKSSTHSATVAGYVSEKLTIFGESESSQASASAQAAMNSQHSRHSIQGTLVVSIVCTHKNAQVFAPYILDVDKAVESYNAVFPDDRIKTESIASAALTEMGANSKTEKALQIISGATYGSSFVAMVHVLNNTQSDSSQHMETLAASLQETFDIGGWFAEGTGGFGVSSTFSNSVMDMLSSQNVQSHCSVISMGIIPSIKSNNVKLAVKEFTDFDPAKQMEALNKLQAANVDQNTTVASAAAKARQTGQMVNIENAKVGAVLSGVSDIDDGQNKILDINSVMNALDDYINRCVEGNDNLGVPINYYMKRITKSEILRSWLAKYYPNKFNRAGSADDSTPSGGGSTGGDTTNADAGAGQ